MSAPRHGRLALLLLPLLSLAGAAQAPKAPLSAARLADPDEVRQQLGLLPDYAHVRADGVKVAVLDYGFDGVDGKRPYLPADTVVVEHYDPGFVRRFRLGDPDFKKPFTPMNSHGRLMAQIVWAVTGSSPNGPKFYLLNAGGPTLFRRAVRYAIEQKVDVILFSGHFEGAGNYDGRGPINKAVDEAVAAGIIWVNAAGNDGGRVYNGPVQEGAGGWLRLTSNRDATALRFRNLLDENTVTVTLTWNDYRDEEDAGTAKDLDLYVEDAAGRVLGSGTLRQVTGGRKDGESRNPRERVVLADLAASDQEYRIRVRRHGGRFGPSDRLRVLVSSSRNVPVPDGKTGRMVAPVQLLDASTGGEIYPPADNRGVITVGTTAASSSVGPTADGRPKPDVYLEEPRARFTNGEEAGGSSVAAAYFAGAVAVMKASQPRLRAAHLLTIARHPVGRKTPATRQAAYAPAQAPPPAGAALLPPPPLSFNQARALRHAEASLRTLQALGLPTGGVYLSMTLPDGRRVRLTAEEALRLRNEGLTRPPTPIPMDRGKPAAQRQVPTWRTPSPRLLDDLAAL
jgi:hypothetical protein